MILYALQRIERSEADDISPSVEALVEAAIVADERTTFESV